MTERFPSNSDHPVSPDAQYGPIWDVFTTQPGLGVLLTSRDGVIEYSNSVLAQDYLRKSPAQIKGQSIAAFLSEFVGEEVLGAIRQVVGTKTHLIRRVLWQGQQVQVAYCWVPSGIADEGRVLISAQKGFSDPGKEDGVEVVEAGYFDLGPLNVLSDRELEVLTLIGQGMRIKEIADTIDISPKTVESHLRSICNKVKTADRAELMAIAREAGPDLRMIQRQRVEGLKLSDDAGGAAGNGPG